jgi:hypothetical protein
MVVNTGALDAYVGRKVAEIQTTVTVQLRSKTGRLQDRFLRIRAHCYCLAAVSE